jgi:membrane protease YdiL (CAAX protease family)
MARRHLGPEASPPSGSLPPAVARVPPPFAPVPADATPPAPLASRPPRTVADAWSWLAAAAVGFVIGYVLSAVVLVVVAQINGHGRDLATLERMAVPPGWVVICGLVGLWVGFLGAVVVSSTRWGTGKVLADMRWGFRWRDPLIGLAVGVVGQFVLLPLIYLPVSLFVPHLSQRLSEPAKHLTGGFHGSDVAVIALLTVTVVPVVEELFFRGLVLRGFLRAFAATGRVLGPLLAVAATGVVFGAAHAETLEFLGLAVYGAVLAVLAYRFDRLGPSIFAHATFNLTAVLVVVYGGVVRAPIL